MTMVSDMALAPRGRLARNPAVIAAAVLLILALLPVFAGRGLIQDMFFILTMLVLAQLWNLLAGYGGLVSIGQQAFVGIGLAGELGLKSR